MGKTPKPKKGRPVSVRSRAARREASPSIDVDKSLTETKPPTPSANERPSVLALHQGAGVTKKSKKAKPMSRAQRRRHEKGLERADTVIDQLEKKVNKSLARGRNVDNRRAEWEDINLATTTAAKQKNQEQKDDADEKISEIDVEQPSKRFDGLSEVEMGPNAQESTMEIQTEVQARQPEQEDEDGIL
ncbi:hypothetical protein L228DRAFT_258039 [Xylona heveae TC161]|uniref:Alb1-domain-containing protein n=1 Tax=Xylona heveae (strain CBS 132557 / TC161) TaxID=1328760 RepID=A0A165JU70_XYLHT|nr:hypothetical protein L228DRAFT_258039 [Xylona heveae TC161]KZF26634.1 hypothetical protein L228DRAFT_258039 [Xylona heveae TC161]